MEIILLKQCCVLANEKENLGVIFDQVGTPTYARDLAKTCLEILTGECSENISKNGNLYHYSNEGVTSWYDFAISIMEDSRRELYCESNTNQ